MHCIPSHPLQPSTVESHLCDPLGTSGSQTGLNTPKPGHLFEGWLNLVRDHQLCGIEVSPPAFFLPLPGKRESRVRLGEHRSLSSASFQVLPLFAEISTPGLDGPRAGPCQTCNFVVARPGNLHGAGGADDDRLWPHFELEPARLAVRIFAGVHNGLVAGGFPLLQVGSVLRP